MNRKIICNKIKTPDHTILISYSVHDYREHKDKVSNEIYMVDGGNDYLRRNINKVPYEELSVYSDESFEVIRENYHRGTWDKEGNRIWIPMCKMSNKHLENCIVFNIQLGLAKDCFANQMYQKELDYRKENGIEIID